MSISTTTEPAATTPDAGPSSSRAPYRRRHPIAWMILVRTALGLITIFAVSVVIFLATKALPGNAAYAVLGQSATPERVAALEREMDLNHPMIGQYVSWVGGVLHGDFGTSLSNGQPVSTLVASRLGNSAALVVVAGVVGTLFASALGLIAAARRDSWFDHILSVIAFVVTALPEFVVAIALVIVFSVNVFHWFPAVSAIPPGDSPFSNVSMLVLPVATLTLVLFPYIFRMVRGAMIEAIESDYAEMAELKGIPRWRILLVHAFPNSLPSVIQVIGLNLLYLAGGIVVVEYVFNYPGIGALLVDAVSNRDIPTIQFIVLLLAVFYVFVNIATDLVALLASPRSRAVR
ncbi:peptide/nickel transport system permease protein [Rhodococcus sp. 27YEA15]|uniref:ABC transporter permease n=1 Tax=Rhodococcus sp. 27YEA15 TaxID=3156259 RepID=UPI003C7A700C